MTAQAWLKKKRTYKTWAVLRHGFSGLDVAGAWISTLAEASLPGVDFTMLQTPGLARFTERIAGYDDTRNS